MARVTLDGKLLIQNRRHGVTHFLLLDGIPENPGGVPGLARAAASATD